VGLALVIPLWGMKAKVEYHIPLWGMRAEVKYHTLTSPRDPLDEKLGNM
jgi:hypothetical protein